MLLSPPALWTRKQNCSGSPAGRHDPLYYPDLGSGRPSTPVNCERLGDGPIEHRRLDRPSLAPHLTRTVGQYAAVRLAPKGTPADVANTARRNLTMIDKANDLADLRSPPGNRLEALKGDRHGQHSIRINDQWRV